MKQILFLTTLLICVGTTSNVFGQKDLVEVFDGRQTYPESQKPTDKDEEFFENLIKSQEAAIKTDLKKYLPADCSEIILPLEAVLEGSFTKPKSAQKAFVYYGLCREHLLSKKPYSLLVAENGKIVFNRFYSTENLQAVKQLPDINRNGLTEIVFVSTFHFGSMMDYSETWLDIFEFSTGDSFDYLGKATTYWWAGLARDPKNNTANYKIFVEPAKKPIFFRETYRRNKDNEWILNKKLEKFELTKKEEKTD